MESVHPKKITCSRGAPNRRGGGWEDQCCSDTGSTPNNHQGMSKRVIQADARYVTRNSGSAGGSTMIGGAMGKFGQGLRVSCESLQGV